MRTVFRAAALIVAALAACGVTAARAAGSNRPAGFRIGVLCPLEGRYSTLGESFLRGASIALKEARTKGMGNVELVVGDTRGAPLTCRAVAERLVAEERVDALLGEVLSSSTIAAAQVAELSRVVLLSPVATEEGIDDIGKWVFQTSVGAEVEIAALARMACGRLGLRRIAYLSSDDPASRRNAALFADEVERAGARLVDAAFYPPGSTDFTEILRRIADAAPEALFIGSEIEDLILILPQLSYHEFGVQLLGTSAWDSRRLIRMAGKDLEGAIFPADVGTRAAERQFLAACSLVNEPPGERNQVVIGAYRGTRMLVEAAAKVKSGGEPLREEMSRVLEKRRHPYLELASGDGMPFYTVRGEKLVEFEVLRAGR
jgi:ABC-type branched-subunit amino acid transport system substrate-binding protein